MALSLISTACDLFSSTSSTTTTKTSSPHGPGVILAYVVFGTIAVLVYHLFAEGEFSSILTLSAVFQCLAFSLLGIQALSTDSVRGISAKSLQLDALALVCRLSSTTWLQGYLPADTTGDFLYQTFDCLSLGMVLWLLHRVLAVQRRTYDAEEDGLSPFPFALVSLGLAALLHGDLDDHPLFDTLWMCGLFISAVSVMPQLWMMSHGSRVSALTSHFVAVMAFSRVLSGLYMWHAHTEITCEPWIGTFNHSGYAILAAHVIHLMLLGDFVYFYAKNLATKGIQSPLKLPEAWAV
jgi:hypothetical protein